MPAPRDWQKWAAHLRRAEGFDTLARIFPKDRGEWMERGRKERELAEALSRS